MKPEELKGLVKAYASIYTNLSESHYKVGDKVTCKESGMTGKVVEVDPEEKGKYYTVDREDGKKVKYAPEELERKKENQKEEVEVILSYLLDEGYADNEEAATIIIENMSEEWMSIILEAHPLDRQRLAIQQKRRIPTFNFLKPKPKKKSVGS